MTIYRTRSKRLLHWFLVLFAGAVAYCGQHPIFRGRDPQMIQAVSFRGMRPSDEGGRKGIRNPERGLRIETLIAEPPDRRAWDPAAHLRGKTTSGYSDDWWILDTQCYDRHGLTLAQTNAHSEVPAGLIGFHNDGSSPVTRTGALGRSHLISPARAIPSSTT